MLIMSINYDKIEKGGLRRAFLKDLEISQENMGGGGPACFQKRSDRHL